MDSMEKSVPDPPSQGNSHGEIPSSKRAKPPHLQKSGALVPLQRHKALLPGAQNLHLNGEKDGDLVGKIWKNLGVYQLYTPK